MKKLKTWFRNWKQRRATRMTPEQLFKRVKELALIAGEEYCSVDVMIDDYQGKKFRVYIHGGEHLQSENPHAVLAELKRWAIRQAEWKAINKPE